MKYTDRLTLLTSTLLFGVIWFLIQISFPSYTIEPINGLLLVILLTFIFWFVGGFTEQSKVKNQGQLIENEKNEKVLEELFNHVDVMLWIENISTGELFISNGFTKIFGYEYSGHKLWIDRIHPEDKKTFAHFYDQLVLNGEQTTEFRIIDSNDELKWVEARATTSFNDDGKVVKHIGILTNINDRKKMEIELIESEKRYRILTEISPKSILVLQDHNIIYANPSALKSLGAKTNDQVIGQPTSLFFNPIILTSIKNQVDALQSGETLEFKEVKINALDGKKKVVEFTVISIKYNGSPSIMVVGRDITEQRELSRQFKESEEQYRKLVEYSPNGIAIHHFGEIRYVNPAGSKYLGATKMEELVGKNVLHFFHSDYHDIIRERWAQIKQYNKPAAFLEEKMVRLNGEVFDVEVMALPITINEEKLVQMIYRDITDRKRAEALIYQMAYHDPLTELPNRRFFEERLVQTLKRAKESNERLSVLFLDLDGFKEINDTFGHKTGDLLLKETAYRLKSCIHIEDTLSRLAGDEFIILLEDSDQDYAIKVAEAIIKSMNTTFIINGNEIKVTTSIGISFYLDGKENENEELIKQADIAMYLSKQRGKNSYHIYNGDTRK